MDNMQFRRVIFNGYRAKTIAHYNFQFILEQFNLKKKQTQKGQ